MPEILSEDQISYYSTHGFVRVPGVLSPEEVARFQAAALDLSTHGEILSNQPVFLQMVNVWTQSEEMKALTQHPGIGGLAEQLAGVPLRIWHDQILIKKPHNEAPTEFHQDQPYWPHLESPNPITAWIALCDVPVERGCMTFIPGSQQRTDLPAQNLSDAKSLFGICPELAWDERVTLPLRAGDCTFHHGRCAHMATPNFTDDPRVAHAIIYMDAGTLFSGKPHPVTQPLGLAVGDALDGEVFPRVADFES
ncbi:phytanoyl-CoA dioxygenase family protein [bacterium]|nr:MAG: phytanoyl-CoA dioxygenase family protein [bacterium]